MTYNHNSHKSTTKFPAAQTSKPSNVAWSAAANDGQADVTTNTSGLVYFVLQKVSCEPGYSVCVLTPAEPLRVTQRTPGVRSNPG